jgi:hypothetical protein
MNKVIYTENAQGYGAFAWKPRRMKIKMFEGHFICIYREV